jgi:AmmeMemoRadiSam system protein A
MLSREDRRTLLQVARDTIRGELEGLYPPDVQVTSPALKERRAVFVSLHNHGRLRGCIGTFQYNTPLYEVVQRMARAATHDTRFLSNPVTAREMKDIDLEISVLSPLEKTSDPLAEIELGRHGICIESPWGSGCFLPQVATETGWSKEEFLSRCAAGKAGLPADAWKSPDVTVFRFEAEVFGEQEHAENT